jgi:hypothetical protein
MLCMATKTSTIPFGGELPPHLVEAFDAVVSAEGWTKKRALAAAVRAFITADAHIRYGHYRAAYDPLGEESGASRPEAAGRKVAAAADRAEHGRRRKGGA